MATVDTVYGPPAESLYCISNYIERDHHGNAIYAFSRRVFFALGQSTHIYCINEPMRYAMHRNPEYTGGMIHLTVVRQVGMSTAERLQVVCIERITNSMM